MRTGIDMAKLAAREIDFNRNTKGRFSLASLGLAVATLIAPFPSMGLAAAGIWWSPMQTQSENVRTDQGLGKASFGGNWATAEDLIPQELSLHDESVSLSH